MILQPSCSEYIWKLKLTKEEKEFALVIAKLKGYEWDDEFLDCNSEKASMVSEEKKIAYEKIKEIILAKREGIEGNKLKRMAVKLK